MDTTCHRGDCKGEYAHGIDTIDHANDVEVLKFVYSHVKIQQ